MSIPRALLLALALMQAVGLVDYMRRVECEQECKSDGCDDTGPCDCSTCPCHCPGAAPTIAAAHVVAVKAAPPQVSAAAVFVDEDDLRASPDPREILHVPRTVAV